jgi:FdhD protein
MPVSFEFNGQAYAVMLATPDDLVDFAYGFALAEGIVTGASEVLAIDVTETPLGYILRIAIPPERAAPIRDRARRRVCDGGCGLCGVETLRQAMRKAPKARGHAMIGVQAVFSALQAIGYRQTLNAETGAVHAAALCLPDGTIAEIREDVGRHNAFDKLIGALARNSIDPASGFALLSSRCSYELVDKALVAGIPALVTVSAPTSLAISRAIEGGLTLVALARSDTFLVLNDPDGRFDGP